MAGWILPALGYVVLVGIAGITTKVALRTIDWQQVVYWVPVTYLVLSVLLWLVSGKPMVLGVGGGWAIVRAFRGRRAYFLLLRALEGRRLLVVPVPRPTRSSRWSEPRSSSRRASPCPS